MADYSKRMRVLAIDPGPTWMGWALLDVQWEPGVRTSFVEGGHHPCDFLPFASVLNRSIDLATGLACPLAMVVETPAGFAFQPGRVPQLLLTAVSAGGMAWMGKSRGLEVVQATAQQVRKVLAGKANADDQVVKDTVEAQVYGARGASNDHVRDAVAVGLLGAWVLTGRAVLPVAKPKEKKPRKTRQKAVASC